MTVPASKANDLDFSRGAFPLFAHQKEGVRRLVDETVFALFDEMGAGKTLQVIYATQLLYEAGVVDHVIVVAPATVRGVWFNPELGEIRKHVWPETPVLVQEFHARIRSWTAGPDSKKRLTWTITNYDFIRTKSRLQQLIGSCSYKTLLVLDESSAVKNYRAIQTIACLRLRKACGRVVLLNGTPIENHVGDLFSQAQIMNKEILGCNSWFHFRARYAIMGGWMGRQILAWRDVEDIQRRLAPYVLRRLKKDCLDLPEKLPPVSLTVPLTTETWKMYREMRDEMVTWLSEQTVSVSAQAAVKALRLAQVASGFLGGLQDVETHEALSETKAIGREKLDLFLRWYRDRLEEDPKFKVLVWCRFRNELHRLLEEVKDLTQNLGTIHGSQSRDERERALMLLDPRTSPDENVLVAGTLGAGAKGLNLAACHTVVYLSNDFRYGVYSQSLDRVHRPGQVHAVSYYDVVATGPNGQRTIDHVILAARKKKDDMATWTTSAWIAELTRE